MEKSCFMIAGTGSGSGKTLVTCGLLRALVNRNLKVGAFKCGPDYIDPMFHTKVIGASSINLDGFLMREDTIRYLYRKHLEQVDVAVMEGVMGFYDGLDLCSIKASSHEMSLITDTKVLLIIDCEGMYRSMIPVIKGFLEYQETNNISGVILNKIWPGIYETVKECVEKELDIKVYGYVPQWKDLDLKSRHLGLVMPDEILNYQEKLDLFSIELEKTVHIDEILRDSQKSAKCYTENIMENKPENSSETQLSKLRIGLAYDEAFCFYYQDNLELITEMGAELIPFSPLRDQTLPKGICGLILGGGYPELHGEQLNANRSLRNEILDKLEGNMPCIAECGGFMYLHESMSDLNGKDYSMVGAIKGHVYKTKKLQHFGYLTLESKVDQLLGKKGKTVRAHEFHYYESSNPGNSCFGKKRDEIWNCIHGTNSLLAGFPHIHYYDYPWIPKGFLKKAKEYGEKHE